MQFKSIFTILAAGLSLVMANAPAEDEDITTTSTSTMTMTVTITECNPTATDCPAGHWPKPNSTVSAQPTWVHHNASSWAVPTHKPTAIETSVIVVTPTKAKTSTPIPTSGAAGLFIQSGLMLSLLGAGVALVA